MKYKVTIQDKLSVENGNYYSESRISENVVCLSSLQEIFKMFKDDLFGDDNRFYSFLSF